MKFPSPVSVQWIAQLINAEVIGDDKLYAEGINEIHKVEHNDLCFVDHPKYYEACLKSAATHIIINTKDVILPEGKTLLVTAEPFEAYLKIVDHFRPFRAAVKSVSDDVVIGANTIISPHVFIGKNVKIGSNCVIYPNVSIMDYTEIGDNVIIQTGSVIGSDGFYYNTKKDREVWYKKMQSCGNVIIEDDVEIGANCTIDRGVTASTKIGKGTKIDNLVHLGHDVQTGENCLIAAQVGIAGVVNIEDGVVIWGQVGISKTLTIGKNAMIMAQTGVVSSVKSDKVIWGTPAIDFNEKKRQAVWIKRVPEMWEKLKNL